MKHARDESALAARRADDFARIVVIATQQIGDVLLTTPLIHAIRLRWPQATLDVLGLPGTLAILAGNPDVDHCIEVPPGRRIDQARWLVRTLWRSYDLAFITRASDRAHLYGWAVAKRRSGLLPLFRDDPAQPLSARIRALVRSGPQVLWKRALLDHAVLESPTAHTLLEKMALLGPWSPVPPAAPLLVPPGLEPLPEAIAAQLEARFIVIHVPSMWRYKQWPTAHFRALASALLADGWQLLLSGGPSAADRERVAAVGELASAPRLLDLAGRLSFNQLATLLRSAALYIGPDTSVTHLAAAVGTPTVALFGPTKPPCWGPWPAGQPALQPWALRAPEQRAGRIVLMQGPDLPSGPCVPCGRAGCDDHRESRAACLEGLTPERVIRQARLLLEQTAATA